MLTPRSGSSLLREAVHQFLQQNYHHKELLIFNNHPVPLVLSDSLREKPIRVVNAGDSFATCGEIMNAATALVSTPYMAQWDDDDIYLPDHLRTTVRVLEHQHMKLYNPIRQVRRLRRDARHRARSSDRA